MNIDSIDRLLCSPYQVFPGQDACPCGRVGWWLPRFLTEAERPGAWLEARARFDATDPPVHAAYEFTTDDGLVLLYIATDC